MKRNLTAPVLVMLCAVILLAGVIALTASAADQSNPRPAPPGVQLWPPGQIHRPMAKVPASGLTYIQGPGPRVDIPFSLPAFGPDVQVSHTDVNRPHNEMMIAANPTNPLDFVSGANDYAPDNNSTGYYYTMDGGLTWAGDVFRGPYPGGSTILSGGDPVVTFDGQGNAYFTDLGVNVSNICIGGVYLHKSTDGGATWAPPVQIAANTTSSLFNDKEWVAADKYASSPYNNRVYVTWTKFTSSGGCSGNYIGSPIKLKYSANGGATWSGEVSVSGTTGPSSYDQGSNVQVASNGTVYVMWDNEPSTTDIIPDYHVTAKSTDGGATFSPEVRASNGQPNTLAGVIGNDYRTYMKANAAGTMCFRMNNFPVMAVSPTDPNVLYHVWDDGRWDSVITGVTCHHARAGGKHGDIAFNRSTDGGATWSAPVRLNDDPIGNGKDQFFPAMDVGSDGTVHVMWNDRRDDPNNLLYHTYYTQSTDGGLTWSANQRVSDVPSNPGKVIFQGGDGFIGDYNGIAVNQDSSRVLPVWTDTRSAQPVEQDQFTDPGALAPAATPTPCTAGVFADVPPSNPFYPYVTCLVHRNIVSGYSDCTFRPNNNNTRGQIAKIMSGAAGFNDPIPNTQQTFEDVPPSNPFWVFVERMYLHGAMSGYNCGSTGEPCVPPGNRPYFRWAANATRGQLSKIDAISANINDPIPSTQQTFEDVPHSNPFWLWIEQLAARGVIGGYTCGGLGEQCVPPANRPYFRWANNVTRGQVSKIVYNTFFPNNCNP